MSKEREEKMSEKQKYLDFVLLTNEEHAKLVILCGADILDSLIDDLNNYIGSKGRKYRSHYHVIRAWHKKNGRPSEKRQKTKLFPISGKTCSRRKCPLPAVYKDTGGNYDTYSCIEHMPEKVKEIYG